MEENNFGLSEEFLAEIEQLHATEERVSYDSIENWDRSGQWENP